MNTLKFVRDIKDTGLLSLGIEGEESVNLTVNLGTFAEIGSPSVGDALDDGQMEILLAYDEYHRAMKKALNILAYRDNNRFNLKSKLIHAGFRREACERVTEEMVKRGYIDERAQLERIITVEANSKLRGPMKIIPALVAKGYSASDVRAVMSALCDSGEVDFKKNAKTLLEKKLPDSDSETRRKFLYKHGYKI